MLSGKAPTLSMSWRRNVLPTTHGSPLKQRRRQQHVDESFTPTRRQRSFSTDRCAESSVRQTGWTKNVVGQSPCRQICTSTLCRQSSLTNLSTDSLIDVHKLSTIDVMGRRDIVIRRNSLETSRSYSTLGNNGASQKLSQRRRSCLEYGTCLLTVSSKSPQDKFAQSRNFSSMTNLTQDHQDPNEKYQPPSPDRSLVGAAATITAAAIALLVGNSSTVHASEISNESEAAKDNDEEVSEKLKISPKISENKSTSGSFILQDMLTNTLYLITHDPDDKTNSTTENSPGMFTSDVNDESSSSLSSSSSSKTDFCHENGSNDVTEIEVVVTEVSHNVSTASSNDVILEPAYVISRGGTRLNASSVIGSILPFSFGGGSQTSETTKSDQEESSDQQEKEDEKSSSSSKSSDDDDDDDGEDDKAVDSQKKNGGKNGGAKKERVGFRDRKIIDYENRIRAYSTPDKIFRYFATYKSTQDSEIFMTPEDFLRSLTPGVKQPDGLGLDQFKKFDPLTMNVKNIDQNLPEDSIFFRLGTSGFISFSDYVFMLTILSTSRRQFEIAFRMFDLNGDGDVDAEEFEQVQNIIRQTTSVGSRHRDHSTTGNTLKGINSALANYFFGENLDGKLTIERFLEFQQDLQQAILTLEFQRKDPDDEGMITEKQFAELLLTYADYSPKKRASVLKRVKKKYKVKKSKNGESEEEDSESLNGTKLGIALEDYIQIFAVLIHIDDVDKALSFYNLAGASIDKPTLRHVAKVCAGVELRDHVLDVLFTIFDEDGDGVLSNSEFVSVMKNKLKRGLEKPKDIGIVNLFSAIGKCAKSTPIPAGPTLGFSPL